MLMQIFLDAMSVALLAKNIKSNSRKRIKQTFQNVLFIKNALVKRSRQVTLMVSLHVQW